MFKKQKAFIIAGSIVFLVFSGSLLFSEQIINFWYLEVGANKIDLVKEYFTTELNKLSEQVTQLVSSKELNQPLEEENVVDLISVLANQPIIKSGGRVVIMDPQGIVLTRTHFVKIRGDNLLLTTNYGAAIQREGKATWVDVAKNFPYAMGSGQLIESENTTIGAIIVLKVLDDSFANEFKTSYLKNGEQIAFYSLHDGIVGTSFGSDTYKLLSTYFNIGTLAKNDFDQSQRVNLNGQYYVVQQIPLMGIDDSNGGMLVFIPSPHSTTAIIFAALITLLYVLIVGFILRVTKKHLSGKQSTTLVLSSVSILIIAFLVTDLRLTAKFIRLKESSEAIYNSTMQFVPDSDIFNPNYESRVTIKVVNGGEAINTAKAVINYDPTMVKVTDLDMAGSFCDMIVEKIVDNENGQTIISCGLPSPGITTTAILAHLILQPLREGEFSLKFGEETAVLANDGLGTNVLRAAIDSLYQVVGTKSINANQIPSIYSYTHPNSLRWYNRKKVGFAWASLPGRTYRYSLDQKPGSTPKGKETTSNAISLEVPNDGIYYFHLASLRDGKSEGVSHFRVMIDSQPPKPAKILTSSSRVGSGDIVRFDFQSEDSLSGVSVGYYIKIDDNIFLPVKPPFYAPFFDRKIYRIVVRTFDKAGNFSDSPLEINVQ